MNDKLVIEIDPMGKDQHELGAKLDSGKPDLSLLVMFGKALSSVGQVGTIGAKKYTRGGWQFVPQGEERYTAAMLRHLFAENDGALDDDTGMLHAAQVAWNALARLELMLRRLDDERKKESKECNPAGPGISGSNFGLMGTTIQASGPNYKLPG